MTKILKDSDLGNIEGNGRVLIGGCFDILHPAHLDYIKRAKNLGKILIVLLESDENVKHMKGKDRPLNTQIVRAENLAKIGFVDYIINISTPASSKYYYNLVKSIHPDIIAVTSPDPLIEAKREQAEMVGGKVIEVMERDYRYSSSKLLKKEI